MSEDDADRDSQTVLVNDDGGFGLPEARTYTRDDGTEGTIPPDEVFMPPLRTAANGWHKYHAKRDCGRKNVRYVENTSTPQRTTDRYDWRLYCGSCGHLIDWGEVLYLSETWYWDRSEQKQDLDWGIFDKLHLSPERVLDLGPDPLEAELINAIDEEWDDYQERVSELNSFLGDDDESNGSAGGSE